MKTKKTTLLLLFALLGMGMAQAETVSPYLVDFNTNPGTGNHDFAVASNWKHIVPESDYDGYGPYYMSYSFGSADGINGSGALLAYRQYAGDGEGGEVVKDILVTPQVSGTVQLYVKASGLASTTNPSWVEFYNVDDAGTTLGSMIQKFTTTDLDDSDVEGWKLITLNVSQTKRLGLRAQYVYMDNFSATSAEIVPERKVTVSSVVSPTGRTPVICNQKEDGSADVSAVVTLKNNGDADLVAGEEDYTLSFVWKKYYGSAVTAYDNVTFAIPEDMAVGAEKTFTVTFNVPADVVNAVFADMSSGYFYTKVKENVSQSVSSAMLQCQFKKYESKFVFDKEGTTYYSNPSATTTPIDFGKISEATTLNYEIYNPGNAPLTINSVTLSAPFTSNAPATPFTVAAGEKQVIAITMPYGEPGIFTGNLVINYTNFGKEAADYTLGISGTILDPSKNMITFSNAGNTNGQFPEGSIHSDQVYITSQTVNDVTNYYLQSTGTVTKFITPLLTAAAGESFTFDTWYTSYNSSAAVTVYSSTDRVNWTQIAKETYYTGIGSTVKTFTATIAEAGDCYLAFELTGNALLDNIYGLTPAPAPAHDWYFTSEADIPSSGTQNKDYTAGISLKNISAEADNLTATLYMDGEAVATQELTLPGNDKTAAEGTGRNGYSNIDDPTVVNLTFKPHTAGTFPAYIELKAGDYSFATDVVNVTIGEEVASSAVQVGERVTTTSNVPFYFTWADDSSGKSMCDVVYTPEQLAAFGIEAGSKIASITFTGTPSGNKTFSNGLTVDVWVGLESGTITPGEADKDNMLHQTIIDESTYSFTTGEQIDFTITFGQPLEYDGTSSIRIFTNTNGYGSYINMSFPADSHYGGAYYAHGSGTYSSTSSPVALFGLVVETPTISGTVSAGDPATPVEGATVTLYNEENDVQYQGTTDSDGHYAIDVIQGSLTYVVTVSADGYEEATAEDISFSEGSVTQDFTLTEAMPESVTVTLTADGTSYSGKWALDFSDLDITAYKATQKNAHSIHCESVTIVPANTGIIIKGTPGEYQVPTTMEETTDDFSDNLLVANVDEAYTVTAADEGYVYRYVNKEGTAMFQKASEGQTVSAGKAYLRLTEASALDFIGFEEETTSITNHESGITNDGDWYTLDGRRINGKPTQKGVYIVNGKKVVKK